jgi:hypothetical protein
MVKLGRRVVESVVAEQGAEEFVRRLGDPVWFQSLGCLLAFDWNASGLTTTLTAALKEAIRGQEERLGIYICGGKGRVSRRTPEEIRSWGGGERLVYTSKTVAKVDSALVQDGYQLYHHAFIFTPRGAWTVIQQGMHPALGLARRYHWHDQKTTELIVEPHRGIAAQKKEKHVLNLTAKKSEAARKVSVELVQSGFRALNKDLILLSKYTSPLHRMARLQAGKNQLTLLALEGREFKWHPVVRENFLTSPYLRKILQKVCYLRPPSFEELLAIEGVGPKTIRALALVGEVIYGAKPSYEDPARYSFAHGGKDAVPFPVDRETYDQTLRILGKF